MLREKQHIGEDSRGSFWVLPRAASWASWKEYDLSWAIQFGLKIRLWWVLWSKLGSPSSHNFEMGILVPILVTPLKACEYQTRVCENSTFKDPYRCKFAWVTFNIILPPRVCENKLLKMILEEENATRAKEKFQETKGLASVPVEHKSIVLITK